MSFWTGNIDLKRTRSVVVSADYKEIINQILDHCTFLNKHEHHDSGLSPFNAEAIRSSKRQ